MVAGGASSSGVTPFGASCGLSRVEASGEGVHGEEAAGGRSEEGGRRKEDAQLAVAPKMSQLAFLFRRRLDLFYPYSVSLA